jgi:hypothetical protein
VASTTTPSKAIAYLVEGQGKAEVSVNDALNIEDIFGGCIPVEDILSAPPTGVNGKVWLMGASPSGVWSARSQHDVAIYFDGWIFRTPVEGWLAWVKDENKLYVHTGAAWAETNLALV